MPRRSIPEQLVLPEGKNRFTLSEVAQLLNRHKITIYNWERNGLIKAAPRIKRTNERIYTRADVEEIWRWMTEIVPPAAQEPVATHGPAA